MAVVVDHRAEAEEGHRMVVEVVLRHWEEEARRYSHKPESR